MKTHPQKRVDEALDNAIDNDYEFRDLDPEQVAEDLTEFDSDFENCDLSVLTVQVKDWFVRHPK